MVLRSNTIKKDDQKITSIRLKKLPRSFYFRETITIAKDLLGKYLVRKYFTHFLIGKIVEVEAYLGESDPASHAFKGRTKRNDVMFWKGGHLYIYFTYGMHYCCNIVTEEQGKGRAVLIRAVEPIENMAIMQTLRRSVTTKNIYNLTNGPAKVCQAFALERKENGVDLCGDEIWIGADYSSASTSLLHPKKIVATRRIGITNGLKHKWRFYIDNNPWVSKK